MRCEDDQIGGMPVQIMQDRFHRIRSMAHDFLHPNSKFHYSMTATAFWKQLPPLKRLTYSGKIVPVLMVVACRVLQSQAGLRCKREFQRMAKGDVARVSEIRWVENRFVRRECFKHGVK